MTNKQKDFWRNVENYNLNYFKKVLYLNRYVLESQL